MGEQRKHGLYLIGRNEGWLPDLLPGAWVRREDFDQERAAREAAEKKVDQDCEECSGLSESDLSELLEICKGLRNRIAELERESADLREWIVEAQLPDPAQVKRAEAALELCKSTINAANAIVDAAEDGYVFEDDAAAILLDRWNLVALDALKALEAWKAGRETREPAE